MARPDQVARERAQVEQFLRGRVDADEVARVEPDPPDFVVRKSGAPILAVEVTEYHPATEFREGRVGVERRWIRGLWPKIDALRRGREHLSHIDGHVIFRDPALPADRHHDRIAVAAVRAAEVAALRFLANAGDEVALHFMGHIPPGCYERPEPDELWLSPDDWPTLGRHVSELRFRRVDGYPWPHWQNFQAQSAWSSPVGSEFRRIIEGKEQKLRAAIGSGRYEPGPVPAHLLIVSGLANDLSSHVFPSDGGEEAELRRRLRDSGYKFEGSPYAAIWLLSGCSGRSIRLYPAPEPASLGDG